MNRLLLIALLFTAGCAGDISGYIFLDQNGNNIRDEGEPGYENVSYTVTIDGNTYKGGTTGKGGQFKIDKGQEGYYCINLKTFSTSSDTQSNLAKSATKAEDTQETEASDTSEDTDKEDQDTEEDEEETNQLLPTIIESNKKACIDIKSYSRSYQIDLPIIISYSSTVANIVAKEYEIGINQDFEAEFSYPNTCKLYVTLPNGIKTTEKKYGSGPTLDISSPDITKISKDPSASITEDAIAKVTINFKGPEQLTDETKSYIVESHAICPDGTKQPLPSITVTAVNEKKFSLKQSIMGSFGYGNKVTLSTTIANKGKTDFVGDATLVINLPKQSKVTSLSDGTVCRDLITQAQCDLTSLDAGANRVFSVTFKFPDEAVITSDYDEKIETELIFPDGSTSIEAPDIPIFLPKPKDEVPPQ